MTESSTRSEQQADAVPCKVAKTTGGEEVEDTGTPKDLAQICCSGYVFYMSDGSMFERSDVQPVNMDVSPFGVQSSLEVCSPLPEDDDVLREGDDGFQFHQCEDESGEPLQERFRVSNRCRSWDRLSPTQQQVLTKIQERVDCDRAENRYFSCAVIEGPGGCGKTRLMSHVMNHRQMRTLVLYITKQNKRVQDFVHTDCLKGELDGSVQKPIDMTPMSQRDIESILRCNIAVGRYAVTAEKLVFAVAGLRPKAFDTTTTAKALRVDYTLFQRQERKCPDNVGSGRNIVILLDEYTMHPSPLIHALAYHIMKSSGSPLLLIMAGDKLQCGPVGWTGAGKINSNDDRLFTDDVRMDIVSKMRYEPLEVKMEKLQRCDGDASLGCCVKRLRRVCEEATDADPYKKNLLNLILARYSVESGVKLYVRKPQPDGVSVIAKVAPKCLDELDFDGSGFSANPETSRCSPPDDEEFDEKGVTFEPCSEPPTQPTYDLLPLVNHFVGLYAKLTELSLSESAERSIVAVHESVGAIRDLFPVFVVLTNNSCNVFAETFLLALHAQVRKRLLKCPVPDGLRSVWSEEKWREQLKCTLRRNIRRLAIDEEDSVQRQTLFVGMVYKMTSTFKTDDSNSVCNGETVVLTSIVYNERSLACTNAVTVRKLQRDAGTDFKLCTGFNKNRMTNAKKLGVMPFVPYVSENIYQLQGNTIPRKATSFIDLVNVPCKSAYVAVSRFQDSRSIGGIILSE